MSYNKLNYSEMTPVSLLVALSDLIDMQNYLGPANFEEGETFEGEAQKIITEITNQIKVK